MVDTPTHVKNVLEFRNSFQDTISFEHVDFCDFFILLFYLISCDIWLF